MITEEKAQAYDEVLNKLKRFMAQGVDPLITRADVQDFFPELKESEDERIRRNIIRYLKKTSPAIGENIEKMLAWLEKQGEQKPIDKVEPKFHEGEWIISKYMHLVMQIINNDNGSYKTVETDGTERNDSYDFIERNFKLWTIQDAKDMDVLVCEDFGYTSLMLFESFSNGRISLHCWYNSQTNNFHINTDGVLRKDANITPATKEQRDLLFQKMKESGYEWDADKKELKKIEDEPENYKQQLMSEMTNLVKDYIRQKPSWSEEDECYMSECIGAIATKDGWSFEEKRKTKHWLKSLKERCTWKPSDEQIKALHDLNLTGNISYAGQGQVLIELYNDLKKLAEE